MQAELFAANPATEIRILGVNSLGAESGNQQMCDGRVLPWLQDVVAVQAWNAWGANVDDVVVVDRDNLPVAVYNLLQHPLSDPVNYAELRQILLDVAGE
ncbi:MAG: hypothetical protein ACREID_08515 [Planctomycetota bacterium]